MARFGYLNQSNPLTIADHEAQEMINCSIERGWIEYKDYPVPVDEEYSYQSPNSSATFKRFIVNSIPNRKALLPYTDKLLLIEPNTISNKINTPGVAYFFDSNNVSEQIILGQPNIISGRSLNIVTSRTLTNCYGEVRLTNGKSNYVISSLNPDVGNLGGSIRPISIPSEQRYFKFKKMEKEYNGTTTEVSTENGYSYFFNSNNQIIVTTPQNETTGTVFRIYFTIADGEFLIQDTGINDIPTKKVKVFYALTTVCTDSSSPNYGYESKPSFFDCEAKPYYERISMTIYVNYISGVAFNLYRIPFGGDEYLGVAQITPNTNSFVFNDEVRDEDLGANPTVTFPSTLGTEGDTNYSATAFNAIIVHINCLFMAKDKFVYYSKPNVYGEFPAENFLAFPDKVVGFCPIYSELAILTEKEIYILYGDNVSGLILNKINYHSNCNVPNSAQSAYGKILSLTSYDSNTIKTQRDEVLLSNTRFSYNIGLRIKDLLDWTKGNSSSDVIDCVNKNTVLENRYYVAELIRNETQNNVAVRLKKNLVYDILSDGFCVYDESINDSVNHKNYFKYRTKEFQIKGMFTQGAQYHKSMWVRGKGNFKVKFYGDNVALSNDESGYVYDNSKNVRTGEDNTDVNLVKTYYFNIRPDRYVTFSIEFIGEEGAEIHDWGIL